MGTDLDPVAVREKFSPFADLEGLNKNATDIFARFVSKVVKAGEECRKTKCLNKGWCVPNPLKWPGNLQYVSLPESFSEFFERDAENNNCICDKGFKSCVKPKGKGLIARYRKSFNSYNR
jgi:hypothetical protein